MLASTHARRRTVVALGATALLAVGLTTTATSGAAARTHTSTHAGTRTSAARAGADRLPYENPALPVDQRVSDLLGRMSLEEKIGQMTQAERGGVDSDTSKITSDLLGSVLSGGGSVPTPNEPTAWADMIDRYQAAALATPLHIPIIYGIDVVHGDGNMYGATVFPHNIGLGATRDPALVRRVEHVAANETRASGPQWAFAPCVCVARDDRWGRTYESFGEKPSLVRRMETAIDGFQGPPGHLSSSTRVLATAKHFAGDGLTTYGTGSNDHETGSYPIDQGVDEVSHRTFRRLALAPYVDAVQVHHVGSVMPSYSDVDWSNDGLGNRINMHGNRALITGWLKGKEGFDGFVISDYEGIHHIHPTTYSYAQQVAAGVNAGIDMFMEPYDFESFEATLEQDVADGLVQESRIDDAVSRILTAKFELGLFEHPYTDRTHLSDIGSAAHRAVARRAVAESQVLLKNRGHTLPLAGRRPVYVAGSNADSMGNQAGGWTLQWQGDSSNQIPGQTILDGIESRASAVTYSERATAPVPRQAVGVVVVGETPYAEGVGDVGQPGHTMRLTDADAQAVRTVCARAHRCVVLVVSGRPMIIPHSVRKHVDALVASWLPGSEGEGVSDVLFGAKPFTGRLPVSWPRTLAQEPINVGDASYHPLYPFGWGLRTR
jgi:beta-glucosidase